MAAKLHARRESDRPFEDHSTVSLIQKIRSGALSARTSALIHAELTLRGETEKIG